MMNEAWLLTGFGVLFLVAMCLALYPLRKSRWIVFLAPVMILLTGLAYWQWGGWSEWVQYLQTSQKQQRVEELLQSLHGPAGLVEKLKVTLKEHPDSARGWYLLGRLYASQNQWQQAHDAFVRAHRLQTQDEQITINYAQSVWELKNQSFDTNTRKLLNKVLERNPEQPDAIAMLALDAYRRHDYQQAIKYWNHLLKLLPSQSEEAKSIRKAILKAQVKSG